jgi:putative endonuclease
MAFLLYKSSAMTSFYVYILFSQSTNNYYIGFSENPERRLSEHNDERNKKWTRNGRPWTILRIIPFESKSEALKAERFIKKQKSRKLIETIVNQGWKE